MDAPEVAPEPVAANDTTPQESSSTGQDKENPKKNNVRKRTKTGCLTCRKRRIKCDEGKPVCNNCTKSKRTCEGYIQRVVFKDPIGYQTPFSGPYIYRPSAANTFHPHLADTQQRVSMSQGPLQVIAPKPPHLEFQPQPGGFMDPPPYQVSSGLPPTTQLNSGPLNPPNAAASEPNSAQINPSGVWPQDEQYNFNLPIPQHSANGGYKNSNPSPAPAMHPTHTTGEGVSTASLNVPRQPVNLNYEEFEEECMDESDDDMEMISQPHQHQDGNQLGLLLARRMDIKMDTFGIEQRTFGYEDNILSSYMPSMRVSLLRDPATADVFRHFIQVTGPSMSLYERHPYDPSPIFHGQPVPKSRQHIWTYAFPLLALGHPGLLHAMLALGSLQMAKYQDVPPTASLKHYHLALTRVKKNINSPLRRTQPATLAATLLLGYFEVWSSDHDKWCKHLLGSRLIIKEIPYAEMTRAYLAARHKKRQRLNTQRAHQAQQYYGLFPGQQEPTEEVEDNQLGESDLDFVCQLTGRPLAYEGPEGKTPPFTNTDKSIDVYQQYADLYWWYCKMDVYQSILSGTKLFMDFRLWTQCLPRAPIGCINEIYGTYDHLMLLLGRTTSFAALDLARKRRSMASRMSGPPGMGGQGGNNRPSLPSFPGMLPRGKISTNLGFSPPRESSPQSDDAEDIDLEASTAAAMREWEAIRQAYEIYRLRMTDEFQPLTDEFQAARQSPFGPVRTYRTSSIAGIWMNYYMGLIVLYRAHPTMPPVAMVAAGRMAKETAEFAAEIGRIAAGLSDDTSHSQQIPTLVAAAWIESSFCLFVAAIQYQDAAQRDWLIRRMLDIARLTGWQSAKQIAGGCESAWSKAAEMGRGPPYERREGILVVETSSVWVNPRRIDRVIREAGDTERRLVLHKSEQAHYALGLLGVEQDLEKLDLQDSH